MTVYYFYAFLAAGSLNFICSILILRGMAKVGIKVGLFEFRWQIHKHLKAYRQSMTGKPANWLWAYYGYQGSLAAMIGFGLLAPASLGQ